MRMLQYLRLSALTAAIGSAFGCGEKFDPSSKITSVRVLATRADKPYAAPGETVTLEMLAFDGRASKPHPMQIYWVPSICTNPASDNYYECYATLGQQFEPGIDISERLVAGEQFAFQVPDDIIATHGSSQRGGADYGLVVAFSVACAGHVEYIKNTGGAADALPFGCFDDAHNQLSANDFVFAYSLVYSFLDRTNANPEIEQVTFDGDEVAPAVGVTLAHCTQSDIERCPSVPLDTVVPDSSQELDPSNLDVNGNVLREQIWVDYYLTGGKLKHESAILFEPHNGRVSKAANEVYAPQASGDYMLWAVVHDNRGGVNWVQVPMSVN